jgi:hypothetical protein
MVAIRLDGAAFGATSAGPDDGEKPALVCATSIPARDSSRAMEAMRSDSFTRNSPTSQNSERPSASAAATASAGISSIDRSARSPSMRAARSGADVQHTRTRPSGSPMASAVCDGFDGSAHQPKRIENSRARGIEPDTLDGNITAGTTAAATSRECRGRKVARHLDGRRLQRTIPPGRIDDNADAVAGSATKGAPRKRKHALAMVARKTWLFDASFSAGLQTGQDERAFELGAGHGQGR